MSAPFNQGAMYYNNVRKPKIWRERIIVHYGLGVSQIQQKGALAVPNWIVGRTLLFFFISFFACLIVFGYPPQLELIVTSILSVIIFLYGSSELSKQWQYVSEKRYLKNVFWLGVAIRLIWVLYVFFIFHPDHYGTRYGDGADVLWYMPYGEDLAEWIRGNHPDMSFPDMKKVWGGGNDDVGYPVWLAIVYLLSGSVSDVFVPMLVKTIVGAYCAVLIYNIANRHFGVGAARMAAIFVALNPNMIYWCGSMMKEAEMVFLCCLSINLIDKALSSNKKLSFRALLPGLLVGLLLLLFRMALGLVFFLSVMAHIVFVSNRVLGVGKKILAGVLVILVLGVSVGDRLYSQTNALVENVQSGGQNANMEWRSKRVGGNSLAKYAGAAIFAPLIVSIPFPTFNSANASQLFQVQLSGGFFIKNVFSFFVILVMLLMFASGEWRKHVFILAYTGAYLVVLVFSNFAHSGRFHMPIFPMLLLFAAYGIQMAKGNARIKNGYQIVLVAEILICLVWNWFKLRGRGMV